MKLRQRGLQLITGIRKNMKNYLMPMIDKLLLRRRFIVETVFDALKSQLGLVHTRHRSPTRLCPQIFDMLSWLRHSAARPAVRMLKGDLK